VGGDSPAGMDRQQLLALLLVALMIGSSVAYAGLMFL
jgi:hypothetical protein